jgi:hypothetical protein
MLKTIAIIIVVAILALLAFAATRPDAFRVQRQTSITAAPDRVFALINDFHNWASWSLGKAGPQHETQLQRHPQRQGHRV